MDWEPQQIEEMRKLYREGYSKIALVRHFNTSLKEIEKAIINHQLVTRNGRSIRAVPDDFRESQKSMGYKELCTKYRCSQQTLQRWYNACDIPLGTYHTERSTIPPDWVAVAPTMTKTLLALHYNVSVTTINKWLENTGVDPKRFIPTKKEKPVVPPHRGRHSALRKTPVPSVKPDEVSQAAHYIRRFYPNVFRADLKLFEAYSDTWGERNNVENYGIGKYFVSGLGVISDDEVVKLADRLGFRKDKMI